MAPLHKLTEHYRPRAKLVWTKESLEAFDKIKAAINACPKLFYMDAVSPIHLYTDASDIGVVAYLCQKRADGKDDAIAFMSATFNRTQRNWHVPEREAYAIVKALQTFEYLLRDVPFVLHTDHKNLIYIRDTGSKKVINWKNQIQEYSFTIEHVPGEMNTVADRMSRNTAAMELPEEDGVGRVELPGLGVNLSDWGKLKNTEPALEGTVDYCNGLRNCFVIPEKEHSLIRAVHNEVSGHHGVETTLKKLAERGDITPMMRAYVKKYIRECDLCQKNAYHVVKNDVEPYTTGSYTLMDRLNIDSIGPLPQDEDGNKYIIVIIDCFSRWIELFAAKDTSAASAGQALLQHIGRFGAPSQLLSDQGSQFVNGVIAATLQLMGTQQITTMAYSKQENSIVERSNKEVMRYLRDLCYARGNMQQWSQNLPFVQRIHNAMEKKITGFSPADILFGGVIALNNKTLAEDNELADIQSQTLDQWLQQRKLAQARISATAAAAQEKHDCDHMEKETGKRTTFDVGELVLRAYPVNSFGGNGKPNKLHTNFRGPYTVVERIGEEYILRNAEGRLTEKIAVHFLAPFHYDKARPRRVGLKDTDSYDVERIVSHNGSFQRKTKLTFVVKWEGYPATTVEPWKNLRYNSKLHDYLRDNNLEGHIPACVAEDSD